MSFKVQTLEKETQMGKQTETLISGSSHSKHIDKLNNLVLGVQW
jgi:hypothetical protein